MAFSKVPRIDMGDPNAAITRIVNYLIKQQDELEYKFLNLDSDNIIQIDANVTEIKNLDLPLGENVITEVIHQQVINVETAHILNAWIKNLFVEYLETNFDALVWGDPTVTRNYIRIINEQITFYTDTLSTKEYEPLFIPDPNGSNNKINVYYTSIGDHPDAYRYFTITNPKSIHKDLTNSEVENFKVYVKKTIQSSVKASFLFKEMTTESGVNTVMPIMIWGQGSDPTGTTDNGKGFVFKDDKGLVLRYITQTGKIYQIRIGENGIEGAGGNFKSLDHYTDGFIVNGNQKFKWVAGGLQKEDGSIIPIREYSTPIQI